LYVSTEHHLIKRDLTEGKNSVSEINTAQEKMTFAEFQLDDSLEKTLSKAGFKEATSIQKLAIPVALEGRDILASAPTGTGKTLACLFPAIH
jgi:ATP-dependent RNA helicase SrmB